MKLLILDRGFIDGKNLGRCKQEWGVEVLIPMKRNRDLWADAWALGEREPWQVVAVAPPPAKPPWRAGPRSLLAGRPSARRHGPNAARPLTPPRC